jgi:FKBP-type peptidyl-prolyl cis-trans isomerase
MNVSFLFTVAVFALVSTAGCDKGGTSNKKNTPLVTFQDSVSYIIGTDIGKSLTGIKDEVMLEVIVQGINDQLDGKTLRITQEQAKPVMQKFSTHMNEKEMAAKKVAGEKNLIDGKKFLEENKNKKGVVTTPSGLQYIVLTEGTGPKPIATDAVKVNYKGTLLDETEFDSSYKRGEPVTFSVTGVIKGWTEVLLLMNSGSKYKIFVPSELAYGGNGAGPQIGPNAVLIFEIELIEIVKGQ